jgi:hypothetical protein
MSARSLLRIDKESELWIECDACSIQSALAGKGLQDDYLMSSRGPSSEPVDVVGRANLEPVVTQIVHLKATSDLHKRVLNPYFEIIVLHDLRLIALRPALLGHLAIVALTHSPGSPGRARTRCSYSRCEGLRFPDFPG